MVGRPGRRDETDLPRQNGQGRQIPMEGLPPAPPSPLRDSRVRVLSALVMAAAALATAWLGGTVFVLFWLVAAFALFREWQCLLDAPRELARLLAGGSGLAVAAALASGGLAQWAAVAVAVTAVAVGALAGRVAGAWASAGAFYAGAMLLATLALRLSLLHGLAAILFVFAVVWGTDILAYFSGRLVGGPKLWPRVSPGKTWSGFGGGVLGGALAGVATVAAMLGVTTQQAGAVFLVGLGLAIVSQGGDLFESAVKRRYGVKDSSNLIPGHGGVMDRLDGFAAAVVAAALLGVLRGGDLNGASGLLLW